jgi:hypothetical protein
MARYWKVSGVKNKADTSEHKLSNHNGQTSILWSLSMLYNLYSRLTRTLGHNKPIFKSKLIAQKLS